MQIIRTTNPNGTYRYEIDGEVQYAASRVLYTHVSTFTNGAVTFHKTAATANKAKGYKYWTKSGVVDIIDGDAPVAPAAVELAPAVDETPAPPASVAQHAETIATVAVRLMETGRLRVSTGLSTGAITTALDVARGDERTRAAGIALAHGHDADIRAAFKSSVPPAVAPAAQLAPRVIDQWETHDGETYAYDVEGNRVIEISARTRATRWGAGSNVRSWAVIRNGVAASGQADGLRAAKRDALAALTGIDATRPERQRTPRLGTRVVPIDGPTQFRGRSGRVEAKGAGDDGQMYYTVDFGNGVNWPFTLNQLNVP